MIRYLARRFATMLVTLAVISALVFVIINLPPGNYLSNQIAEMKATGEVMSIANSFEGAMMKAVRSIEMKLTSMIDPKLAGWSDEDIRAGVHRINDQRLFAICEAFRRGIMTVDEVFDITKIDTWFLYKFLNITNMENELRAAQSIDLNLYDRAKQIGFLDRTISELSGCEIPADIARLPVYKTVDTCAAEFYAETPYY